MADESFDFGFRTAVVGADGEGGRVSFRCYTGVPSWRAGGRAVVIVPRKLFCIIVARAARYGGIQ